MSDVIHRSIRDFDVAFEIICEWSDAENEFDRIVAVAAVTFTAAATLCWIISDIISRMTVWIISCIFWFDRSECWLVISTSLEEKEIIEWHDSLCFWKIFELRVLSFCSMIFETSFLVFSDNDCIEKFSFDSDNLAQTTVNESAIFLRSSVSFLKKWANDAIFFEESM